MIGAHRIRWAETRLQNIDFHPPPHIKTTSDQTCTHQSQEYYGALLVKHREELQPNLLDMLTELVSKESFKALLGNRYWSEMIDGDALTQVKIHRSEGGDLASLKGLRRAAWAALPEHVRAWLVEQGVIFDPSALDDNTEDASIAETTATSLPE